MNSLILSAKIIQYENELRLLIKATDVIQFCKQTKIPKKFKYDIQMMPDIIIMFIHDSNNQSMSKKEFKVFGKGKYGI